MGKQPLFGRAAFFVSGSMSSHQPARSNPSRWALILGPKEKAIVSSRLPIPISTSRRKPGMASRMRSTFRPACAGHVEGGKPLAASPGRTASTARESSHHQRKRDGNGSYDWQRSCARSFQSAFLWLRMLPRPRKRGNDDGIAVSLLWKSANTGSTRRSGSSHLSN